MFNITVSKSKQPALIAGLKKLPSVTLTGEDKGHFGHASGLEIDFVIHGTHVAVNVVANPELIPEDQIQARLKDDVDTIIALMS